MGLSLRLSLRLLLMCLIIMITSIPFSFAEGDYFLTLDQITVKKNKPNGKQWDTGFGKSKLPDLYVSISVRGRLVLQAQLEKNNISLEPHLKTESFSLEKDSQLEIIVYDKDLGQDDYMGKVQAYISAKDLGVLKYYKNVLRRVHLTLSLTDVAQARRAQVQAEAQRESVRLAQQEAERKAVTEAQARQAAERKAQAEAQARQVAEQKAQAETQARQLAEQKAQAEAQARKLAEQRASDEAIARQKAEQQAKAEAQARQKAEQKAKAETQARQEIEAHLKAQAQSPEQLIKKLLKDHQEAITQKKKEALLKLWRFTEVDPSYAGTKKSDNPGFSFYRQAIRKKFTFKDTQTQIKDSRALVTLGIFAKGKLRDQVYLYIEHEEAQGWRFVNLNESKCHGQAFLKGQLPGYINLHLFDSDPTLSDVAQALISKLNATKKTKEEAQDDPRHPASKEWLKQAHQRLGDFSQLKFVAGMSLKGLNKGLIRLSYQQVFTNMQGESTPFNEDVTVYLKRNDQGVWSAEKLLSFFDSDTFCKF